MKSSWDYLDLLPDKKAIINFLKREVWTSYQITKSKVEFYKCEIEGERLQEMMEKYLSKSKKEDHLVAQEIDDLAIHYNNEKDVNIKLKILEKRERLLNKLKKSHKEWERINDLQDANHKYWEKIYSESKKEEV